MPHPRSIELRVGIFVLAALAAMAVLIVGFGKFQRAAQGTYTITVIFPNASGLVRDANVIYAGVPVGRVSAIELTENHTLHVRVKLRIYEGYTIREDARFTVNQSGLLGDRYIDVSPQTTTAPPLRDGDEVRGQSTVDVTEAMRGAVDVLRQTAGTLSRIDEVVRRTDAALQRVDELLLNTQNLTRVSQTLANVDSASSNAVALTRELAGIVAESRSALSNTFGRVAGAADNLRDASQRIEGIVEANEDEISATASNLAESTARLSAILENVQNGEGTVGRLLTDPTLHDELTKLVSNWRRYGILYRDRSASRAATTERRRGRPVVPARPARPPG